MSSSFKRRTPTTQPPPPPGTRLNVASSVLEISTGVPSLDDVLGGGQPLGSILTLLTPDRHSNWSELLQRYWIAQGLASGQQVCVVGEPSRSEKLVEGCMWLSPAEYGDSVKGAASEDEREPGADEEVKIAWRYEGMKKFQTTVRTATSGRDDYNHTFELTQKIPSGVIDAALQSGQLQYLPVGSKAAVPPFDEVLDRIKEMIKVQPEQAANSKQTVMRLAIPEFGGLYWGDTTPEAILRFLYLLRGVVQSTQVSILITMPPHLAQDVPAFDSRTVDGAWITKLGFLSDGCLSFSSFGDNPALSSAFPAYHGLVHVHRAPSVRSLVPPSHKLSVLRGLSSPSSHTEGGGENNLGFKCTRKRFVIETLHLDVEGGVSERRTAPPISATVHEHNEPVASPTSPGTKAESARIAVEAPPTANDEVTSPVTTTKPKKARKVVAFQSGGRDLDWTRGAIKKRPSPFTLSPSLPLFPSVRLSPIPFFTVLRLVVVLNTVTVAVTATSSYFASLPANRSKMTTAALLPPDLVSLEDNSFFDHEESEANQSIERTAQPHPFDGMHFDSEDDQPDDDDVDDDQDEDYAEDDSFSLPPQASLHQQHDQPIPPPIPTHSRPPRLPAPKFHNPLPVANSAHRAANQSRAVILPTNHRQPQNKPRQARRVSPTNPPLIASSRPSNVRRAGAPSHRATLSVSSQGLGDAGDPSIPDPNEEGIIMISGAQAMHMTFLDFGPNMYLIRKDLTDPLYPSFLEPPSKLTPLRCLCCKKVYNGPNARSMWRRHITQKHQFILGGKKGNGKGKKEVVDDENRFPGETAEEAILRRREQALQMKREWSRNRRLSNRAAQEETHSFAVPKMMARSVSFGSQTVNTEFLQHGVSFDQLNAEPLAQWQSSGSLVEMSRAGVRTYGHPRNMAIPPASDVEDDDEDDEPLSNQLSVPIQPTELEPSPALDSPQAASFTPLPESGAAAEDAQHEPQLVENEEPSKDARSDLHQAHLFQHLGSEFEYDFVLGTSPVVAITQLPVLSQPKDQHLNGLPELSYSFTRPLGALPGTPARIAATRQLTDAERRNILSLESPRGIPFPRSKTSTGIIGGADVTTRPTVSTPARPTGMMRSVTMPALALHSTPLASDTSLQSLMPETPGNGSVSYLDHMPPTPFRDILGGSWDWHMFESPVVKRKRSQTDEGPVSTKDSTTNVLSSTTLNANIGGDMHVAIMEGDFFEKFFDLPKTPGKKGLGFSEAGGSENVAVLAEDGTEDGRKAKRARFI